MTVRTHTVAVEARILLPWSLETKAISPSTRQQTRAEYKSRGRWFGYKNLKALILNTCRAPSVTASRKKPISLNNRKSG